MKTKDGTCVRDYIHIKDLAQAHILALKPGISGAYNLLNGHEVYRERSDRGLSKRNRTPHSSRNTTPT